VAGSVTSIAPASSYEVTIELGSMQQRRIQMQPRMKQPVFAIPEAMTALQALSKSTENRGFRQPRWRSSTCA
jgi:hypothetical protein